jgi:hypothetical protein
MNGLRVLGVDVKSVKVSRAITRLRFIKHEKTKKQWHQLIKDYLHTHFHACGASGFGETLLTRIFRKMLNNSERGQSSKMVLPSIHFVHQDTSVCIISSRHLVRIKSYEKWSKILDDLDLDMFKVKGHRRHSTWFRVSTTNSLRVINFYAKIIMFQGQ